MGKTRERTIKMALWKRMEVVFVYHLIQSVTPCEVSEIMVSSIPEEPHDNTNRIFCRKGKFDFQIGYFVAFVSQMRHLKGGIWEKHLDLHRCVRCDQRIG
jgi:hypothetical protein